MTTFAELQSFLESHEGKGWTKAILPAKRDALQAVENKLRLELPEMYRQFLLYADGGLLESENAYASLFDTNLLQEFNPHPVWSKGLPDMVFIGSDEGSNIYFFDPQNRLQKGSWAIYGSGMSDNLQYATYIAKDLKEFAERIVNNEAIL